MSKPAAMIVTRTRVLYSELSDSHEDIIKEHGLDDGIRGGDFVRIEICPSELDYSRPLEDWVYRVDQDDVPNWYDPREAEEAARAVLPKWAKDHIISQHGNCKPVEITKDMTRIVLKGQVVQSGGKCWMYGHSANIQSGGMCRMRGHSTNAQNGGDCWMYGHSNNSQNGGYCRLYEHASNTQGGGVCRMYGHSTNTQDGGYCDMCDRSTNTQSGGSCEMFDNSTNTQGGGVCARWSLSATLIKETKVQNSKQEITSERIKGKNES